LGIVNADTIRFSGVAADWGKITHVGMWRGGVIVASAQLYVPETVRAGDIVTLAPGSLVL
jgi:hypothetical protein